MTKSELLKIEHQARLQQVEKFLIVDNPNIDHFVSPNIFLGKA